MPLELFGGTIDEEKEVKPASSVKMGMNEKGLICILIDPKIIHKTEKGKPYFIIRGPVTGTDFSFGGAALYPRKNS